MTSPPHATTGPLDAPTAADGAPVTAMPPSRFFEEYTRKAETLARDPTLLRDLVASVESLVSKTGRKSPLRSVADRIEAMARLLRAHAADESHGCSWNTVVTSTAAFHYLVSPSDLVPDWAGAAGLQDDAAVVDMAFQSCQQELEPFAKRASGWARLLRRF